MLFNKYYDKFQIKEGKMCWECKTHEGDNPYKIIVGKPEGKKPLAMIILKWVLRK
jgi:hypothetical protein